MLTRFKLNRCLAFVNVFILCVQACMIWYRQGESNCENHCDREAADARKSNGVVELKLQDDSNTILAHAHSLEKKLWNFSWDERNPAVNGGEVPTAMRYIYLVRHGQYFKYGPNIKHLTELGKKQASAAGKRLADMKINFDKFYVSTMTRAQESADLIQPYFPHLQRETSDLLREGRPIFPQNAPPHWEPSDKVYKEDNKRIASGFKRFIYRAFSSQKKDSNELFVIHGNVIAYFVLRALQLREDAWLRVAIFQGSITRLDIYPDGGVQVKFLGDVGHLMPNEWTN